MLRYPGGKSKLHKPIVAKLLSMTGSTYVEPFFGGGSIGLKLLSTHSSIHTVILNDKVTASQLPANLLEVVGNLTLNLVNTK